ncbi:MAG: cache domain-containing protein [Desulfobacterales bacterium]|nr:cache domain-containing protein [Desulfobacterales bacterium]
MFILIVGFTANVWAGEATQDEVMAKCQEAAKLIQEKGIDNGIKTIGSKEGPFVWKDTYVFLMDLDGKMLAHPMSPQLTEQKDLLKTKNTDGKLIFVDFIKLANDKGSGWVDYMWPKPGQEKPVEKSTYIYRVPGTQYLVGAGIYK